MKYLLYNINLSNEVSQNVRRTSPQPFLFLFFKKKISENSIEFNTDLKNKKRGDGGIRTPIRRYHHTMHFIEQICSQRSNSGADYSSQVILRPRFTE